MKTMMLYRSNKNYGDHRVYSSDENREGIKIRSVRGDTILKDIESIKVIKVDVQGYEKFVFDGMREVLLKNDEVKIISEFWPTGMIMAGSDPAEYLEAMKDIGFTSYFIDSDNNRFLPLSTSSLMYLCAGNHQIDVLFSRYAV